MLPITKIINHPSYSTTGLLDIDLELPNDPRNITFDRCVLRAVEGYVNMVFQCPIDQNTVGVCPNNCVGVDPAAIVAGGTALVAATALSGLNILPVALGATGMTLVGGTTLTMMLTCHGPLYCRVGARFSVMHVF